MVDGPRRVVCSVRHIRHASISRYVLISDRSGRFVAKNKTYPSIREPSDALLTVSFNRSIPSLLGTQPATIILTC